MTADADLLVNNRQNVLLVPNAAIHADRANGTYWVNVLRAGDQGDEETAKVDVVIGAKDSRYTQIVDGLVEGDEVLLGELNAPVQFNGFGSGRRG
jgi:multidrug efflux pump subunit AcrA (membrane-fusion protein)